MLLHVSPKLTLGAAAQALALSGAAAGACAAMNAGNASHATTRHNPALDRDMLDLLQEKKKVSEG